MQNKPEGYQPTADEIQSAEDMINPEVKYLSKYRESQIQRIDNIINNERKHDIELIDGMRNGERTFDNPSINRFMNGVNSINKKFIEDTPFEEYGEFDGYDWHNMITEDTKEKWKHFLSDDAYQYIEETVEKLNKGGESGEPIDGEVNVFYRGKSPQAPVSNVGNGNYRNWKEFSDCYIGIDSPYYSKDDDGIEHYNWNILLSKKMTQEEKSEWLDLVEQWVNSDEYYSERTDDLRKELYY